MQPSALTHYAAHEFKEFSELVSQLRNEITLRDVRTGKWFEKMLSAYVAHWEAHRPKPQRAPLSAAEIEAATRIKIQRTALKAALAGAGSAGIVTAASFSTAETGGVAGPFVLPAAAISMVIELAARSILHLDMACEIAALHGLHFPRGRESELVRLYALAVGAEMHETETDPGRGLVERVVRQQQSGELGKLVAARLIGETLLRNVLPVADLFVSSIRNFKLTREVGRFIDDYSGRRSGLDAEVDALSARDAGSVALLLEGIWFVFISDGRLTAVETALLTHLLHRQHSEDITPRFVSDETG